MWEGRQTDPSIDLVASRGRWIGRCKRSSGTIIGLTTLFLALIPVPASATPPGCTLLPERIDASVENRFVPSGKAGTEEGGAGGQGQQSNQPSESVGGDDVQRWSTKALVVDVTGGTIVYKETQWVIDPFHRAAPKQFTEIVHARIKGCSRTKDHPLQDAMPVDWIGNSVGLTVSSWSTTSCKSNVAIDEFLTVFRSGDGTPHSFALMAPMASGCSVFGALDLEPYSYSNGNGAEEVRNRKLTTKPRAESPTEKTGKNAFPDPTGPPLAWSQYGATITLREDRTGRSLVTYPDGSYQKCMTYVGICSTAVRFCCMDLDGKGPMKPTCSKVEIGPSSPSAQWESSKAACYQGHEANELGKTLH